MLWWINRSHTLHRGLWPDPEFMWMKRMHHQTIDLKRAKSAYLFSGKESLDTKRKLVYKDNFFGYDPEFMRTKKMHYQTIDKRGQNIVEKEKIWKYELRRALKHNIFVGKKSFDKKRRINPIHKDMIYDLIQNSCAWKECNH